MGEVSAKQADGWLQHYRDDFIALASSARTAFWTWSRFSACSKIVSCRRRHTTPTCFTLIFRSKQRARPRAPAISGSAGIGFGAAMRNSKSGLPAANSHERAVFTAPYPERNDFVVDLVALFDDRKNVCPGFGTDVHRPSAHSPPARRKIPRR